MMMHSSALPAGVRRCISGPTDLKMVDARPGGGLCGDVLLSLVRHAMKTTQDAPQNLADVLLGERRFLAAIAKTKPNALGAIKSWNESSGKTILPLVFSGMMYVRDLEVEDLTVTASSMGLPLMVFVKRTGKAVVTDTGEIRRSRSVDYEHIIYHVGLPEAAQSMTQWIGVVKEDTHWNLLATNSSSKTSSQWDVVLGRTVYESLSKQTDVVDYATVMTDCDAGAYAITEARVWNLNESGKGVAMNLSVDNWTDVPAHVTDAVADVYMDRWGKSAHFVEPWSKGKDESAPAAAPQASSSPGKEADTKKRKRCAAGMPLNPRRNDNMAALKHCCVQSVSGSAQHEHVLKMTRELWNLLDSGAVSKCFSRRLLLKTTDPVEVDHESECSHTVLLNQVTIVRRLDSAVAHTRGVSWELNLPMPAGMQARHTRSDIGESGRPRVPISRTDLLHVLEWQGGGLHQVRLQPMGMLQTCCTPNTSMPFVFAAMVPVSPDMCASQVAAAMRAARAKLQARDVLNAVPSFGMCSGDYMDMGMVGGPGSHLYDQNVCPTHVMCNGTMRSASQADVQATFDRGRGGGGTSLCVHANVDYCMPEFALACVSVLGLGRMAHGLEQRHRSLIPDPSVRARIATCSLFGLAARWLGMPVEGMALPLMMLVRRASEGLPAHTDDDYDSYSWNYYFRGQCTGGECKGSRLVVTSGGDGGALAMVPTDPLTKTQMVAVAFNTQRSLHFVMSAEGSEDGPCPDFMRMIGYDNKWSVGRLMQLKQVGVRYAPRDPMPREATACPRCRRNIVCPSVDPRAWQEHFGMAVQRAAGQPQRCAVCMVGCVI